MVVLTSKGQLTTTTFSYASVANTNTGTINTWTVPPCVTVMTIEVRGASGGYNSTGTGGNGARMIGVFTVTPGQVLSYLVGKSPGSTAISGHTFPSGGGGSYVASGATYSTATPMIVAGGGGGGYGTTGDNAPVTTSGTGGSPGTGGNGAPANSCGGGGGGFYTSGGTDTYYGYTGGLGFQQGGTGGLPNNNYGGTSYQMGGFGGGAPADYYASCNYQGGAGGGYSGGSAYGTSLYAVGSAGGSFNSGTSQSNTAGYNFGHGMIIFTYSPGAPIVAVANPSTPICQGGSVVFNVSGVSTYTWNDGSNVTTRTVSPTSNTSYTVTGTNASGCTTSSVLTVTVNTGVPVLSINTSTNSVCLGKTVTLTASGAFSYTWTGGPVNGVSFTPSITSSYVVTGANGCGTSTALTSVTVAPLAVTVLSSPTVVCAGSTSTLTAAAAATSYSWFPISNTTASMVVSPQISTVYTVAVSDGTCAGIGTVAVNALPVPTVAALPTVTTVCSGMPVSLSASGGISYTWTPGNLSGASVTVAPNVPTSYQVIGSNSLGCTALANVAVITNPSPTLNIVPSTNLICAGDPVNITVSGASTYTWDSGANTTSINVNPIVSTVYTVTGVTNSCSSTGTVGISVFIPTVAVSGNTSICNGQTATLTASGGNNYTWSNGFTSTVVLVNPTNSTTYSVAALTSSSGINCPSSASIQVTVKPNPTVTAVASRSAMCKGENNAITVSGASTYSWSTGATTTSIAVTSSLVTIMNYSVTGTSSLGCSSTASIAVKINSCTDLKELNLNNNSVLVYPNPSKGDLNVSAESDMKLSIVNEIGQVIMTFTLDQSNNRKLVVSDLANGVYFLISQNPADGVRERIVMMK